MLRLQQALIAAAVMHWLVLALWQIARKIEDIDIFVVIPTMVDTIGRIRHDFIIKLSGVWLIHLLHTLLAFFI